MRLGFGPKDWDLGLEAEIWAWRLGEGTKKEEKKKEEREKIPLCESIGHRVLRGHWPKKETQLQTGQMEMGRTSNAL